MRQRVVRAALGALVSIAVFGCTREREDACARGVTVYFRGDETRACCGASMTGDPRAGHYHSVTDMRALRTTTYRCAYVARVNTLAFYDADGCTSNGMEYHVAVVPVLRRLANGLVETVVVVEENGGVPPEDDLRFLMLYIAADDLSMNWRNTDWARTHGGTYDVAPELPGLCFNPAEGEEI